MCGRPRCWQTSPPLPSGGGQEDGVSHFFQGGPPSGKCNQLQLIYPNGAPAALPSHPKCSPPPPPDSFLKSVIFLLEITFNFPQE